MPEHWDSHPATFAPTTCDFSFHVGAFNMSIDLLYFSDHGSTTLLGARMYLFMFVDKLYSTILCTIQLELLALRAHALHEVGPCLIPIP